MATSRSYPLLQLWVEKESVMAERGYWGGFALGALTGAAAGIGAYVAATAAGGEADSGVLRMERSIQVGRPQREVFEAWTDLNGLAHMVNRVCGIRDAGRRSRWSVRVDGRPVEFEAETTQLIANEAIGWKSVSGPKHTGRVNFAKLGDDTLVHVTMNYHPPLGRFGRLLAPIESHLNGVIEQALREFKNAVEQHGQGREFRMDAEGAAVERSRRTRPEAGGETLENVRGGEQGVDRGRVQADKNELYSPTMPPTYSKHGPQSAGWDEVPGEQQQATGTTGRVGTGQERTSSGGTASSSIAEREGKGEGNAVDYTRPPKASH